jgi:hypothetical protein
MFEFLKLLFSDSPKVKSLTASNSSDQDNGTKNYTLGSALAPEIQLHILSFLTTREQLLLRRVSRQCQAYVEPIIQNKLYAELANLSLELANNSINTPTAKLFELIEKFCDITGRCQQYYGFMKTADKLKAILQYTGSDDKLSRLHGITTVVRSINSAIDCRKIIDVNLKNALTDVTEGIASLIEKALLPNTIQLAVANTSRPELALRA